MTTLATPADDEIGIEITALAEQVLAADGDPWTALTDAGLLALGAPTACGGDDVGVVDALRVVRAAGRAAVTAPVLATVAFGVLPVARWGSGEQQRRTLTPVTADRAWLTAALAEPGRAFSAAPGTSATPRGDRLVLDGVKVAVPYAAGAHRILVPVTVTGGPQAGPGLVLLDPTRPGVELTATHASGTPDWYRLGLNGVEVDTDELLPGGGQALVDTYRTALAGAAAWADGLLAGAFDLTCNYVRTREQFGRPLATFQAVTQHIGDIYIAARTTHLTALAAAVAVSGAPGTAAGPPAPDADEDGAADVEVAAWWLAEQARAALAVCTHLHGGAGADRTYPLAGYSGALNDLVHLLGGAEHCLERLAEELYGTVGANASHPGGAR